MKMYCKRDGAPLIQTSNRKEHKFNGIFCLFDKLQIGKDPQVINKIALQAH